MTRVVPAVLMLAVSGCMLSAAAVERMDPDSDLLKVPHPPAAPGRAATGPGAAQDYAAQLRTAILGEEHAWLKTYGYADIQEELRFTPYPERKYPKHAEDDLLPLPTMPAAPKMDARGNDPGWQGASRGVVRVAAVAGWPEGPLVEQAVEAGICGSDLCLAVSANRFISTHLAVAGVVNQPVRGLIVQAGQGVVWQPLDSKGKPGEPMPLTGAYSQAGGRFEARLPLAWFPEYKRYGLYVTAGIGGRWTASGGRPVTFFPAPFAVRQCAPFDGGAFPIRVTINAPRTLVVLTTDADPMRTEMDNFSTRPLARDLRVAPRRGPLGPETVVSFSAAGSSAWRLTLFQYVPSRRALALYGELIARRAAAGEDMTAERRRLAGFQAREEALIAKGQTGAAAARDLLWEVCGAKRALFLRDAALRPLTRLLFSKRHPFAPSHNYSVQFDSPWRPGGGVWQLAIPVEDGRLAPEKAQPEQLVDAGAGVVRDPAPSFDATRIYYAWRTGQKEYYRIFEQDVATGARRRISPEGPFHDFWPTPLPDGGLAFITTRCKKKFICWRPQAAVLYRMELDGSRVEPLSYANLTEFAPSVMDDGRLLWTRSEYVDKGADYGHTLWTIRADGTYPELTFGNTIALPQGFANARMVPGTNEAVAIMISHFRDLNGPVALLDLSQGPHQASAIQSLTPEVPWPGRCPDWESFREPVPVSRDVILVAHAPQERFGLFLIDRYGNRELLYIDPAIDSVCPLPFGKRSAPPVTRGPISAALAKRDLGQFFIQNVYRGLEGQVPRGAARHLRICQELPAPLRQMPDGTYQADHEPFMKWYASPIDRLSEPFLQWYTSSVDRISEPWPSYVAKGVVGTVPIAPDGSANFLAPARCVLYFQLLDAEYNEIQRMRSVVQLRPGEQRSCVGCHESRLTAPEVSPAKLAAGAQAPAEPAPPPWGAGPFWFERVVQPVLDARCVACHNARTPNKIDLSDRLDEENIPVSYRNLIHSRQIHYFDYGYKLGVPYKAAPYSFGSLRSRIWTTLADANHRQVKLTPHQRQAIQCWIDLNVPLWGDYAFRPERRTVRPQDQGRWRPD